MTWNPLKIKYLSHVLFFDLLEISSKYKLNQIFVWKLSIRWLQDIHEQTNFKEKWWDMINKLNNWFANLYRINSNLGLFKRLWSMVCWLQFWSKCIGESLLLWVSLYKLLQRIVSNKNFLKGCGKNLHRLLSWVLANINSRNSLRLYTKKFDSLWIIKDKNK